jgi:hypothetical protein
MATENRNALIMKSIVHTYIRKLKGGKTVVVKEHIDLRTTREEYIAAAVARAAAKKVVRMPKKLPIIFASGTNDAGEIRGMRDAGIAVGTVANELDTERSIQEVEALAGTGLPVFVDSGAFSEVTEQPDGPPKVTHPITDSQWKERIALYVRLAKKLGSQLNAVAPDQIANQQMTLWRLREYAPQMAEVKSYGAHVLVALQGGGPGSMDHVTFFRRATEALGFEGVPCFPMKKAPATKVQIVEFMKIVKPPRVHFLGMGIRGDNTADILDAVAEVSPDTVITIDANLISGHVGVNPKTGKAAASRTLTAAQDAITQWGHEDPLGAVDNEEWDVHEDFTDAASEPSAWTSESTRKEIAQQCQLTPAETKSFVKDPDEFLQKGIRGDGSSKWYEHPLMQMALETAWKERLDTVHTHVRKHEAMPAAFKHHAAANQFPDAKMHAGANQQFDKLFGGA